jgi:DNA-binding transcriptional MerR regulator
MNPDVLPLFTEPADAKGMNGAEKAEQKERKTKDAAASKGSGKKAPTIQSDILKAWKPEKQYYSIGEVAGLFSINTSHIRFWTKEFMMKVRTTKKGDRLYTPAQITELSGIYHLVKEKGFTLAGAKAKLKEEKKGTAETVNLKESLSKLRTQLSAIRDQLR